MERHEWTLFYERGGHNYRWTGSNREAVAEMERVLERTQAIVKRVRPATEQEIHDKNQHILIN